MPLWRQVEEETSRHRRRGPDARRERVRGQWWARYGIFHDVDGPRVRMGMVWIVLVAVAVALRVTGVTVLFTLACALAGYQVAQVWRKRKIEADPWVAAAGAGLLVIAGAVDVVWVGVAALAVVVAAGAVAYLSATRNTSAVTGATYTLLAALPVGLVGASVATCLRYDEIGAAAVLVAFALAYDVGDFVVGSGASSPYEGPVAGWLAIAAVATVVVVLRVPPFRGAPAWAFAILAAAACPLGQIAGSAILPSARAKASALRRLDTLLVLAPAFTVAVGLFVQTHH